jgi:uncharacterized membrane protein
VQVIQNVSVLGSQLTSSRYGTSHELEAIYSLRSYIRTSLWVVPLIAIPLELIATRLLHSVDGWLGWPFLDLGVSGAQAMLNALITATLSFVVFTFGSLLVALQVASGQLTPRIIATILLRNNVVR